VPSLHDNWASQILAEQFERVFKEGKGYREEWVKKSKNNHQLDCLYGGIVAREIAAARAAEIAEEMGAPKAKEGRIASIRPTTGFRIGGDE
jgi:glutamine synthetase type III